MSSGKSFLSWAEIDLKALRDNFLNLRKYLPPQVKILVTVKKDAYGHGILEISRELQKLGCDFLGINGIEEAQILRKNNITLPILNLGLILDKYQAEEILRLNVSQTVSSIKICKILNGLASKFKKRQAVHLKIDTGMRRLGIHIKKLKSFLKDFKKFENLYLEGVFTHFPSADIDKEFTLAQIREFKKIIKDIEESGLHPKFYHSSNSAGLLRFKKAYFNMVRPGLLIYGINPLDKKIGLDLKPVMSVKSRVIFERIVNKGEGISYHQTYIAKRRMKVYTIAIGYGDGLPFLLSNRGRVLIKDKFYKIVGRVCMDFIMCKAPLKENIKIGQEVIIMGKSMNKEIRCQDIAKLAQTIPYEILCRFGSSLKRKYIK